MVSQQKILDYLFISKVRIKTLKMFFLHTEEEIHLRAIARELQEEINAVRREIMRLVDISLLIESKRGNKKFYSLNKTHTFFEELAGIIYKSVGLGEELIKNIQKLGAVEFACFTNSYLSEQKVSHRDIDLVIIGEVDLKYLSELVSIEEQKDKREINYTVIGISEFATRKQRNDPFILDLIRSTRLMLIGDRSTYMK